jgi:dienelactone hydrolase
MSFRNWGIAASRRDSRPLWLTQHRQVSDGDYGTVAYSSRGAQLWARRYSGPRRRTPPALSNIANAVAAPGNGRVYVTGTSWGGRSATSVAVRAGRVFVTGASPGIRSGDDYATVAYNG